MQSVFLLLLLVFSSMCTGNYSCLGNEATLAGCQPNTCALLSEVAVMRERLAAMTQRQSTLEANLGAMMQKIANVEASLHSCKTQGGELREATRAQDERLRALTAATSTGTAKVAFTAALGSSVGPFEKDTPLKYQRIRSNVGSGYNPATGIFTAMVPGMYYFSYTLYQNNSKQPNSVVSLMMNSQRVVSTWVTVGDDSHDSATNAAVVQLAAGDSVFVKLYANHVLYDDSYYYNTFSGFLVFTL